MLTIACDTLAQTLSEQTMTWASSVYARRCDSCPSVCGWTPPPEWWLLSRTEAHGPCPPPSPKEPSLGAAIPLIASCGGRTPCRSVRHRGWLHACGSVYYTGLSLTIDGLSLRSRSSPQSRVTHRSSGEAR